MKIALITLAAAFVAAIFIYFIIGLEKVWEFTSGDSDMGPVNFDTLKKTPKPNQYLLCPENYCAETPDNTSNTYDVAASDLFDEVFNLIKEDTKRELLSSNEEKLSLRFLTRSPILRFPDTTNIKIIKLSDTQSTLAVYAQAKLGTSDIGANKIRVDAMVIELEEHISAPK